MRYGNLVSSELIEPVALNNSGTNHRKSTTFTTFVPNNPI